MGQDHDQRMPRTGYKTGFSSELPTSFQPLVKSCRKRKDWAEMSLLR